MDLDPDLMPLHDSANLVVIQNDYYRNNRDHLISLIPKNLLNMTVENPQFNKVKISGHLDEIRIRKTSELRKLAGIQNEDFGTLSRLINRDLDKTISNEIRLKVIEIRFLFDVATALLHF